MANEGTDSDILAQERWAIEVLARETKTAIAAVQVVFLAEYRKLEANAHIRSYLPVLTCNSTRGILESVNMAKDGVPKA